VSADLSICKRKANDRRESSCYHIQALLTNRYGNGVYFAAESSVSMGGYAKGTMFPKEKADFPIHKATALVELGEFTDGSQR
jgi:hypothetical protein